MDFFKHKYFFLFVFSFLFLLPNFTGSVLAQEASNAENQQFNGEKTSYTDEEIQSIILLGTLDVLKKAIHDKVNANKMYQCNSPLTLAIRGVLGIQELGENAPKYAIEKMKYLVDIGADPNQETCLQNARFPLTMVLAMPLELTGLEELSNQAINQELENDTGYCNIAGLISKPCKDITTVEIKQLKEAMHQAFFQTRKIIAPYLMEMLSFLISSGADINKKDSIRGRTALHHAAEIPSNLTVEPIKYLIQKGADLNSQDLNGDTPLFIAEAVDNKEVVQILIEAGADTTIRNKAGVLYNEVIGFRQKPFLQEVISR